MDMTVTAPDAEVVREAVTRACRASSLHNSQPWRWLAEGAMLALRADSGRLIRATDHEGRELTLSCGAVLDHLRVAMAAAGWDSATEHFPDPSDSDHLATVHFRPLESITEEQQRLGGCNPSTPNRPIAVRRAPRVGGSGRGAAPCGHPV